MEIKRSSKLSVFSPRESLLIWKRPIHNCVAGGNANILWCCRCERCTFTAVFHCLHSSCHQGVVRLWTPKFCVAPYCGWTMPGAGQSFCNGDTCARRTTVTRKKSGLQSAFWEGGLTSGFTTGRADSAKHQNCRNNKERGANSATKSLQSKCFSICASGFAVTRNWRAKNTKWNSQWIFLQCSLSDSKWKRKYKSISWFSLRALCLSGLSTQQRNKGGYQRRGRTMFVCATAITGGVIMVHDDDNSVRQIGRSAPQSSAAWKFWQGENFFWVMVPETLCFWKWLRELGVYAWGTWEGLKLHPKWVWHSSLVHDK